ncbi:MAG: hypothetical protein AAFV07_12070, partial [Bacteroidota bacterium]
MSNFIPIIRGRYVLAFLCSVLASFPLLAQPQIRLIEQHLQEYAVSHQLQATDVSSWEITDEVYSSHNGVTHVYIRQMYAGIPVYNGMANLAIKNGEVLYFSQSLEKNLVQRVQATQPVLSPGDAVSAAATALGLPVPVGIQAQKSTEPGLTLFSGGNISLESIPVRLMYQPGPEGELFLSWDLSIAAHDTKHWWSVRVDAL